MKYERVSKLKKSISIELYLISYHFFSDKVGLYLQLKMDIGLSANAQKVLTVFNKSYINNQYNIFLETP